MNFTSSNRALFLRLLSRDLQSRYRGSMLGLGWAVAVPLGMVLMYTFVFGSIFNVRWAGVAGSTESMTAFVLTGITLHQFLAESLARAPTLILDNPNYVTKVVFPLEFLAPVVVGVALVGAAIGLLLLLGLTTILSGLPAPTALLVPLVPLAMVPMLLGLVWMLCATGVFIRDLSQVIPIVLSVAFFLGPVIYPRSSVPEPFSTLMVLNPVTIPIEAIRSLVFGHPFPAVAAIVYLAASCVICVLGYMVFNRLRRSFADVL